MRIASLVTVIVLSCAVSMSEELRPAGRDLRVGDAVFAAARTWTSVEKAPHPAAEWLKANRERLRNELVREEPGFELEGPDCSFVLRALYESSDVAPFHLVDVDADGNVDLVYAGPAHCAEGEVSVVWNGAPGIVRWGVRSLRGLALRVAPGPEIGILAVEHGCCAALTDRFFTWSTRAHDRDEVVVHGGFDVPEGARMAPAKATAPGFLSLRYAPSVADRLDEGESHHAAHAAFGNVARGYLPGATAALLGAWTPQGGGPEWVLVRVEDDHLSYYAPTGVTVGWVERRCLTERCPSVLEALPAS